MLRGMEMYYTGNCDVIYYTLLGSQVMTEFTRGMAQRLHLLVEYIFSESPHMSKTTHATPPTRRVCMCLLWSPSTRCIPTLIDVDSTGCHGWGIPSIPSLFRLDDNPNDNTDISGYARDGKRGCVQRGCIQRGRIQKNDYSALNNNFGRQGVTGSRK